MPGRCALNTVIAEDAAARQPYQDAPVATGSTELPGWARLSTDARTAVATAQLLAAALITWESVAWSPTRQHALALQHICRVLHTLPKTTLSAARLKQHSSEVRALPSACCTACS